MARVSKNLITRGMRGMIGSTLVFRKYGSRTVVSAAPEKSSKLPSDKQQEQRNRFRLATVYAAKVKSDPDLLKLYEEVALAKSFPNVHSCIIADYFKQPEILDLKTVVDKTTSGLRMKVTVLEFVKVQSVSLTIRKPDGTLLESGTATATVNPNVWDYLVSGTNQPEPQSQVEVQATDLPGNISTRNFVL